MGRTFRFWIGIFTLEGFARSLGRTPHELEGLYTLWYDNGLKAKEGNFKDGKGGLDFLTWWRENGLKKEDTKFKLCDAQRDAIKEGQFWPPPLTNRIIAEAIDVKKLQKRGVKGEELSYPPNEQKPYT
jgi:antitoxin component YwqK of YwqJK toxin-antitoxin module